MAFSRNSMAAAIAGSLSLAVLTGCNPPAAVVAPSAAPSAAASAAASAAPSAAPSAAASTAASAAPATPAPVVSAPAASGKTVTLSGKVYDEEGALVDGATITIKSLNDAQAYNATAKTVNGNYVFNSVPEGVQVAITATKDKWTSRTQTEAFQASSTSKNEVNFNDAYFISKFPEIVSTTPVDDATGVDASKISYKLTLSEALDETNRRRFENAIRLTNINTDGTSEIKKGSTFLTDAETKAAVTWNAAGTEATLAFNAPLLASSSDESEYKVFLNTTETIEDSDGNDLDITRPFREKSLAGNTWAATHDAEATFKIAEDDTDPKLTGVSVSTLSSTTRIELTFSEPMAAYSTAAEGISSATLSDLANYTFMVGAKAGDLKSLDLDGDSPLGLTDLSALDKDNAKSEFRFADALGVDPDGAGVRVGFTGAGATPVLVSIDSKDAKRVFLTLNGANFFGADLAEIKARVAGVADPAGNLIGSNDADSNLVTGSL